MLLNLLHTSLVGLLHVLLNFLHTSLVGLLHVWLNLLHTLCIVQCANWNRSW